MDSQRWDDRYSTEDLIWHAEPNRSLVQQVAGLVPGRAADLACGEGRNALYLAEHGWQVTAVDFSGVALDKAGRLAAGRGATIDFVHADVLRWSAPPAGFDLVVVMYLQLPSGPRQQALRRAASAVAPGGTLLVVAHDPANLTEGVGGPQDPALLYGASDVVTELGDLAVLEAGQVRRPVLSATGDMEAVDCLVRAVRPAPRP